MDAAALNHACDCVRPNPSPLPPFADVPVFADQRDLDAIRQFVARVDAWAGLDRERGALMGYDFHLTPDGPRLIEINTNAGGALLAVQALDAVSEAGATQAFEAKLAETFRREWEAAGAPGGALRAVAIVDQAPEAQFLFPEFLRFQDLFARQGWQAVIADPSELSFEGARLFARGQPVELVYNRWTDFALETPEAAPLRAAWEAQAIALTPNPNIHAALADKRRLIDLAHADPSIAALVPTTVDITPDNAASLWSERRRWFFKPAAGFASRGAYRGEKLTTTKWTEILASPNPWIAQSFVPASERRFRRGDAEVALRFDVRAIAYAGEVQLFFARLYQGQTTNLRTPGGGFAAILTVPPAGCASSPSTATPTSP